MALLEDEIKELRELSRDVLKGKVDLKVAATAVSIYEQVSKRERLVFDMIKLSAKRGTWDKAITKNLISRQVAIDSSNDLDVSVICPSLGEKKITIDECLDYSGTAENHDNCRKCQNFEFARGQLND